MPIRKSTPEEVEAFYGQGIILPWPGRPSAVSKKPENAQPKPLSAEEQEIVEAFLARWREEQSRWEARERSEDEDQ